MCGSCAPATGINSPRGGVHNPLRASLARSPPRLWRSQAGGLHPQTPRAAPPGAPSRTGPLLPRSPSRRVPGTGATVAGVGNRLRLSMPDALASPSPLDSVFQKQGNRAWASRRLCPPEASVPAAAAVGRPRHRPQGGCPPWVGSGVVHGKAGHRAERQRHPAPGSRPPQALRPM